MLFALQSSDTTSTLRGLVKSPVSACTKSHDAPLESLYTGVSFLRSRVASTGQIIVDPSNTAFSSVSTKRKNVISALGLSSLGLCRTEIR